MLKFALWLSLWFSLSPEAFVARAERLGKTVTAAKRAFDNYSKSGFVYELELRVRGCRRRFGVTEVFRTGHLYADIHEHDQASAAVAARAQKLGLTLA